MKGIDRRYKLFEFFSVGRNCTDAVVNVATVELRFRTGVLIEELVFYVSYINFGVVGFHFCAHGYTINNLLVIFISEYKTVKC